MEKNDYIYGLRAVMEAIEAGKEIDKIFIAKDLQGELASELVSLAKANRVVMQRVPVERINRITRKNHQGGARDDVGNHISPPRPSRSRAL